ncbi:cysteine methyltransferase [Aliidiomarina iranensis]|uniref:Methylated-DNA--protein-cysteine methyltransferase n=1 Tax=Aliidiomarina iranensis TaxID=1434071 RepID=A0A432W2X1_9GAMM|nr:methylated-DNA--[protein]-cysteine S-methyltransferase [Aliidiomarina iranensis]RUO23567.1 cysteine methyltransferase [Aliidiomarina iranensis]
MITQAERYIRSPIGTLHLQANQEGILAVNFVKVMPQVNHGYHTHNQANQWLDSLEQQLSEYFSGDLEIFELPLVVSGTEFQQRVWAALREIPYGATWSYRQLAERVERPRGYQAVGQANGRNPHAIVVPCHRVVQANGSIGGYAGGIERKKWLLAHEAN